MNAFQTAARLLLLFTGGNGRYCGLAIVAEIGASAECRHGLRGQSVGQRRK